MLDPGLILLHHPPAMALLAAMFQNWHTTPGTVLVALGGVSVYIASRAAADALAGSDPNRPGWRAIGHCLPIAMVALMCLHPSMTGRPSGDGGLPQVAVGLLFATSVACLTLVLGIVTYLAPLAALPASRRAWPFVLPAALLALVGGFSGKLSPLHAGMLALLGLTVLNLWNAPDVENVNHVDGSEKCPAYRLGKRWTRWLQLLLALALAGVGGWAMARGAGQLEQHVRMLTGAVLANAVLAPLLILPVLSTGGRLAERNRPESAVSTAVAMVLINLCVLLPLVIVVHYLRTGLSPEILPEGLLASLREHGQPAPYPMISWRVDTVILIVLGFGLIPLAIGRWALSRIESTSLIFGYAIYLALVAILSTRLR